VVPDCVPLCCCCCRCRRCLCCSGILGIIFILIGLALTIVSMATLSWLTPDDEKITYGLVQYRNCNGDTCTTKSLSSCNGYRCDIAEEGGKIVIACGIVSLVVAVAGFIFTYLAHKKGANVWRLLAILSWLSAGALTILAVVLYSKKTVQLDYAYILYLFSSFTFLIGNTVVLVGPGVGEWTNTKLARPLARSERASKRRHHARAHCCFIVCLVAVGLMTPICCCSLMLHLCLPQGLSKNRGPGIPSRLSSPSAASKVHLHSGVSFFCSPLSFFLSSLALPHRHPTCSPQFAGDARVSSALVSLFVQLANQHNFFHDLPFNSHFHVVELEQLRTHALSCPRTTAGHARMKRLVFFLFKLFLLSIYLTLRLCDGWIMNKTEKGRKYTELRAQIRQQGEPASASEGEKCTAGVRCEWEEWRRTRL
jgi:hypothetical protein